MFIRHLRQLKTAVSNMCCSIRLNHSQDCSTNSRTKLVRLFTSEKNGPPIKLVEVLKINSVLFLKNDKVVTNFVNAINDVS